MAPQRGDQRLQRLRTTGGSQLHYLEVFGAPCAQVLVGISCVGGTLRGSKKTDLHKVCVDVEGGGRGRKAHLGR